MTPRLIFLHGFTQTHHHWHDVAHRIAAQTTRPQSLRFVDLPGHGLSGRDSTSIDAPAALTALGGSGTWIGYSMGARFGLAVACSGAAEIERLVLIGGTAGLPDSSARSARRVEDDARADRVEALGVAAFIDEWLALPMFAGMQPEIADRPHRLANTASGLAASLRGSGTGAQRTLWGELDQVTVPVLVLAGERDTKFVEIGHRLVALLPHAEFGSIADAGHAAHAEQPHLTAATIAAWVNRFQDRGTTRVRNTVAPDQ